MQAKVYAGDPGWLVIETDQAAREKLRQVAGLVEQGAWCFLPESRLTYLTIDALIAPSYDVSARVRRSTVVGADQAAQDLVVAALNEARWPWHQKSLFQHQIQCLADSWRKTGFLDASEQGTGKTNTAAAHMLLASHFFGFREFLVVCPKSGILQWANDITGEPGSIWPNRDECPFEVVPLYDGSVTQRAATIDAPLGTKPTIWIINCDVISTLLTKIHRRPRMVVLDESWKFKRHSAKMSQAAAALCEDAAVSRLLNGTPIGNNIGDLWHQLILAKNPTVEKTHSAFMEHFATFSVTSVKQFMKSTPTGCRDVSGLIRMVEPTWFRATKKSCFDMPDKIYHPNVRLEMAADMKSLYEQVVEDGLAALGQGLDLAGERVECLRRQQIAGGFAPLAEGMQRLSCRKIEWVVEWAKDNLLEYPDTRVGIWCRFTPEIDRLVEELGKVLPGRRIVPFYKDLAGEAMEEIKRDFNDRESNLQVLVGQYAKMSYGHNLQSMDYNIYFSHTWSCIERSQSEDRSDRYGREGACHYINLLYKDTIDEDIVRSLAFKRDFTARLSVLTV